MRIRAGGVVLFILTGLLVAAAPSARATTSRWWSGDLGAVSQGYGCSTFWLEPLASAVGHSCPSSAPRWHAGIDIGLPCGTSLTAPVAVTVVSIGEGGTTTQGPGPDYPRLRLPNGRSVLLAHSHATTAARTALATGATVPAGTWLHVKLHRRPQTGPGTARGATHRAVGVVGREVSEPLPHVPLRGREGDARPRASSQPPSPNKSVVKRCAC